MGTGLGYPRQEGWRAEVARQAARAFSEAAAAMKAAEAEKPPSPPAAPLTKRISSRARRGRWRACLLATQIGESHKLRVGFYIL